LQLKSLPECKRQMPRDKLTRNSRKHKVLLKSKRSKTKLQLRRTEEVFMTCKMLVRVLKVQVKPLLKRRLEPKQQRLKRKQKLT